MSFCVTRAYSNVNQHLSHLNLCLTESVLFYLDFNNLPVYFIILWKFLAHSVDILSVPNKFPLVVMENYVGSAFWKVVTIIFF